MHRTEDQRLATPRRFDTDLFGNLREIEAQAVKEIAAEDRSAAVAQAKARILARRARPWWHLPFTIKIERRP